MNDDALLRYSKQIMLPNIDFAGQIALSEATVTLFGLGGLGSAAAIYLGTAGVGATGALHLVDFDQVELSNLQRQIVHQQSTLGEYKVNSAAQHLLALNPDLSIHCHTHIKHTQNADHLGDLHDLVACSDVVLDCTDNFVARYAINEACVKHRTPLVTGAAIRMEGQLISFLNHGAGACYGCLYPPNDNATEVDTCSNNGILGPVVGTIGSLQALQAIKIITQPEAMLKEDGKLTVMDAQHLQFRHIAVNQDPNCPYCGTQ